MADTPTTNFSGTTTRWKRSAPPSRPAPRPSNERSPGRRVRTGSSREMPASDGTQLQHGHCDGRTKCCLATVIFRKSCEARAAFPTVRRSGRNRAPPRRLGDERGCKILSGPDRAACPQSACNAGRRTLAGHRRGWPMRMVAESAERRQPVGSGRARARPRQCVSGDGRNRSTGTSRDSARASRPDRRFFGGGLVDFVAILAPRRIGVERPGHPYAA